MELPRRVLVNSTPVPVSPAASRFCDSAGTTTFRRSAAAGALGRAQRLEQLQPAGEVAQRDPGALEREPEVVRRRGLVGAVYLSPADVAAPDRDQALGLQDPDRLADRRKLTPNSLTSWSWVGNR